MMPRLSLLGLVRTVFVVVGALSVATVLPRLGVPARLLPDLVVIAVAASAVLRGPAPGALLGLAAGWVVDLVPPAGSPLGATALLYAVAGGRSLRSQPWHRLRSSSGSARSSWPSSATASSTCRQH